MDSFPFPPRLNLHLTRQIEDSRSPPENHFELARTRLAMTLKAAVMMLLEHHLEQVLLHHCGFSLIAS